MAAAFGSWQLQRQTHQGQRQADVMAMPRQSLVLPSLAEHDREQDQRRIGDQANQGQVGRRQGLAVSQYPRQCRDHDTDPAGQEILGADPGRNQGPERQVEEGRVPLSVKRPGIEGETE